MIIKGSSYVRGQDLEGDLHASQTLNMRSLTRTIVLFVGNEQDLKKISSF